MTNIEKLYLHRSISCRQETLRRMIGDNSSYSPSGKLRNQFVPSGTQTERACLDEIESLQKLRMELLGTANELEFLEMVNA